MPLLFDEWFSRAVGFPVIIHVWWRPAVRRQFTALVREKKTALGKLTSASRI